MPENYCLRDYQLEIITQVHQAWNQHRSVMVQMPTGTGKTHVLASIVSAFSGRVLIVAHRVELIEQINAIVDVFRSFAPTQDDIGGRIRVESIQTVSRRIDSFDFQPDLIIIDEAHHALAKTYRILWDKWPEAKFLGLTATPCRMNRVGFTDLFDTLVSSWSIAEFIRKGVLSPFDYVSIRPDSVEQQLIDSLQKRGADGDYQVKEMDAVLNRQPSIERLYRSIVTFAPGKKGIVYAISIDHARRIADYYQQQGIPTVAIDSKTPREERKRMVEEFKAGKVQVMVNVDVFSEGFDCPDVEFVQLARPTLSLAKYLQQVGRGLRSSVGKVSCMLIDNVGLCQVFGLPVQAWSWERMFRGELTGKCIREAQPREGARYAACLRENAPVQDIGVGLVISHETLLEKLNELDVAPMVVEKVAGLKAWQDAETSLWGLKRGREKVTEAVYVRVFDIKEGMAAVRFQNNDCGLVDDAGRVIWRVKGGRSMKFNPHRLLTMELEGNGKQYVDLCNLQVYAEEPEVMRYGDFELLKVKNRCYSRTRRCYASQQDFTNLIITDRGFLLTIREGMGFPWEPGRKGICVLKGDEKDYYYMDRWLPDGSAVITDEEGKIYQVTQAGGKVGLAGIAAIDRLEQQIIKELEAEEARKKQGIYEDCLNAVPYQAGMKWGLKVGKRITVPPIYRCVQHPIGKYCVVEKNYSQWGIIAIDGTILVEPKYPKVSIEKNGTALLTQVTGKQMTIKLK